MGRCRPEVDGSTVSAEAEEYFGGVDNRDVSSSTRGRELPTASDDDVVVGIGVEVVGGEGIWMGKAAPGIGGGVGCEEGGGVLVSILDSMLDILCMREDCRLGRAWPRMASKQQE